MQERARLETVSVRRRRMVATSIYPNVIRVMDERDMSVADLAAVIGVSDAAMRRRLLGKANGGSDITAYECHLLCEHFHKSFEWLFATGDVA